MRDRKTRTRLIVFFPPGEYLVSEEETSAVIEINGRRGNIVLKGSGSGPDGTRLFARYSPQPFPIHQQSEWKWKGKTLEKKEETSAGAQEVEEWFKEDGGYHAGLFYEWSQETYSLFKFAPARVEKNGVERDDDIGTASKEVWVSKDAKKGEKFVCVKDTNFQELTDEWDKGNKQVRFEHGDGSDRKHLSKLLRGHNVRPDWTTAKNGMDFKERHQVLLAPISCPLDRLNCVLRLCSWRPDRPSMSIVMKPRTVPSPTSASYSCTSRSCRTSTRAIAGKSSPTISDRVGASRTCSWWAAGLGSRMRATSTATSSSTTITGLPTGDGG